jgi:hypothetical protein
MLSDRRPHCPFLRVAWFVRQTDRSSPGGHVSLRIEDTKGWPLVRRSKSLSQDAARRWLVSPRAAKERPGSGTSAFVSLGPGRRASRDGLLLRFNKTPASAIDLVGRGRKAKRGTLSGSLCRQQGTLRGGGYRRKLVETHISVTTLIRLCLQTLSLLRLLVEEENGRGAVASKGSKPAARGTSSTFQRQWWPLNNGPYPRESEERARNMMSLEGRQVSNVSISSSSRDSMAP